MNKQEKAKARQVYVQPWTESIWLHVENVICLSGTGGSGDPEDEGND
ncbi:MAG: hypothetical protein IKZ60_06835 [Bacteroidales bacterium]|nr:hypothetical protein [Bacteroidales bacterium]